MSRWAAGCPPRRTSSSRARTPLTWSNYHSAKDDGQISRSILERMVTTGWALRCSSEAELHQIYVDEPVVVTRGPRACKQLLLGRFLRWCGTVYELRLRENPLRHGAACRRALILGPSMAGSGPGPAI